MKLSVLSLQNYLIMLCTVLFVLAGGFLPIEDSNEKSLIKVGTTLVIVVYLFFQTFERKTIRITIIYFSFVSLFALISTVYTYELIYALQKVDAVVFCVPIFILVLDSLLQKYTPKELAIKYLNIWIFLVALTVLYKLQFGFFDRNVRFFLNGANVFGWMMGLSALISLILTKHRKKFFLYYIVFFSCVLWSQSKGALLSMLLCSVIIYFEALKLTTRLFFLLVISVFFLFIEELINLLVLLMPNSRLLALVRIATGQVGESDFGSVGIRQLLYTEAYNFFIDNPFFGIGLGNFKYFSILGFDYPHNAHLEMFTEMGLFVGLVYMMFILYSLFKANKYVRVFIVFFILVTNFSGDIGYLRFLFIAILIALCYKPLRMPYLNNNGEYKRIS